MKSFKFPSLLLVGSLALASLIDTNVAIAAPPAGTKLAPEQVLNLNYTSDLSTFDTSLIAYDFDSQVQRMLNSTLLRLSKDGKFIPELASSYSVSPDGLTWTFNIRSEAKWSDGVPVRAQDFVYSWRRLVDPKTASSYGNYLELAGVKNAAEIVAGKKSPDTLGVAALDDHTFQVQLNTPVPWFNTMIGIAVLAPERQDVIEKWGDKWTSPEHMVGTGPYKIASYKFNDSLNFVRNPLYWDDKDTTITNINIDFIKNSNNNYFGFLTGKYLMSGIPSQFLDKAKAELVDAIDQVKRNSLSYFYINPKVVPDIRARKAISLLLDRNIITKKVLKSGIATSILAPANIKGAELMQESAYLTRPQSENIAEAVNLLQAAGYTKDKPLRLKYLSSDVDNKFFVALQNLFNKGSRGLLDVSLDHVESKVYYDRSARLDYELESSGWNADYPQVTTFLDLYTCGNLISYASFCDPKLDKLLDQAKFVTDAHKRAELYAQAELIAREGYVLLPVYQTQFLMLKNPRLQGVNLDLPYNYFNDFYILAK